LVDADVEFKEGCAIDTLIFSLTINNNRKPLQDIRKKISKPPVKVLVNDTEYSNLYTKLNNIIFCEYKFIILCLIIKID
jgi:hypothetical protein